MNLESRVKFLASLDATYGTINPISALSGYNLPSTSTSTPAANYQYVLEDTSGNYEIGFCQRYGGTSRQPKTEYGGTVFAPGTTGLTCTIIASPDAYVNASGDASSPALPDAPLSTMPKSVVIGGGAKANESFSTTGQATVVGYAAEVNYEDGTAIGQNAIAAHRAAIALGSGARSTQGGETALGHASAPHVTFIPIRTTAYGYEVGDNEFSTSIGSQYGDINGGALAALAPSSSGHCDVRVQGTIVLRDGAVGDTSLKVIDLDYLIHYDSGTPTVIYQTVTTKFSGSAALPATVGIDATTKLPKLTITASISDMKGFGLLTVTKIVHSV